MEGWECGVFSLGGCVGDTRRFGGHGSRAGLRHDDLENRRDTRHRRGCPDGEEVRHHDADPSPVSVSDDDIVPGGIAYTHGLSRGQSHVMRYRAVRPRLPLLLLPPPPPPGFLLGVNNLLVPHPSWVCQQWRC